MLFSDLQHLRRYFFRSARTARRTRKRNILHTNMIRKETARNQTASFSCVRLSGTPFGHTILEEPNTIRGERPRPAKRRETRARGGEPFTASSCRRSPLSAACVRLPLPTDPTRRIPSAGRRTIFRSCTCDLHCRQTARGRPTGRHPANDRFARSGTLSFAGKSYLHRPAAGIASAFTSFTRTLPSAKSRILRNVVRAILSSASRVKNP